MVTDLDAYRLARDANNTGPAICKECGNRWTATAKIGDVALKCPSCLTWKGLFEGGVYPANGLWTCNCGCDVFTISETTNILCWKCGEQQGQQTFSE